MTKYGIIDNMLRVPMRCVRDIELRQALTVPLPDGPYCMAEVDETWDEIAVPRAFCIRPYLRGPMPVIHSDVSRKDIVRSRGARIGSKIPALGPNKHIAYDQRDAWRALVDPTGLAPPHGRVLVLGCGKGKTVLSLRLAQHRGTRTLVVCHTLNMVETWLRTARDLFGVGPESIGVVGGGAKNWRRDLVFTTMPGALAVDDPDFRTRFGLVVFDEGDLLGAAQLSRMLPVFHGERLLVTATPSRSDGMHVLYDAHVGGRCFSDVKPDLSPRGLVLDSPVPRWIKRKGAKPEMTERYAWSRYLGRPAPSLSATVSFITENVPARNKWEMEIVRKLLREGRKVLFLGERVEDLRAKHREALSGGLDAGLALGASKTSADEVAQALKKCRVIFAIQQIAKRGLDERSLDTVVIQFGTYHDQSRLQQTVGRVLRYAEGKTDPLVVFLRDREVESLSRNTEKMIAWMRASGYVIEEGTV